MLASSKNSLQSCVLNGDSVKKDDDMDLFFGSVTNGDDASGDCKNNSTDVKPSLSDNTAGPSRDSTELNDKLEMDQSNNTNTSEIVCVNGWETPPQVSIL